MYNRNTIKVNKNIINSSKGISPRIKKIRNFFNITKKYEYLQYMTIHVTYNTSIFIKPDGKYLGLLSKYEDPVHASTSQIADSLVQVNIYSLPDINPEHEAIIQLDNAWQHSDIGKILLYELNWIGSGYEYEIVKCDVNKAIHDPEYAQLYLELSIADYIADYIDDYYKDFHLSENNQSFQNMYFVLNNNKWACISHDSNIHETAIPIGKAPKYKYKIYADSIDVFIRKDCTADDVYEYMDQLFNSLTTNTLPIELYNIILLYMSKEDIIAMISNLKNHKS